jgi:hypothetical protein
MSRLCAFIGLPCRPALFEHVVARESHGTRPLPVEERVADLAADLHDRLRAVAVSDPAQSRGGAL